MKKHFLAGLIAFTSLFSALEALALSDYVIGPVRVQCLSDSLVRLELRGPKGFEDRSTFHVVNREWQGATCVSNRLSGEVRIETANYVVHVPAAVRALTDIYLTSPSGEKIYQSTGTLNSSVWLPGPAEVPPAWSFADSPRLVPPAWGLTPAPAGVPLQDTSGWDTSNDAPDIYVFIPKGNYAHLRKEFLKLTGPTEMIPLYALGMWDSRYYNYSEETALREIDNNRKRQIPQDVMVIDTGWRVNASIGYEPNSDLFPNMPRFFNEAHARNTRVVFNDHPEPEGTSALDPLEVTYRYTNLVGLIDQGLDAWWYDRNWSSSIFSPAPNLRKEVWGMKIYNDTALRVKPALRPLIMANVDGIDNGIRNRPPNVAAHRYSIQWTGDTYAGLDYLNYGIQNAVHAGVHWAYPYMSEDLGGHNGNTAPADYLRWIEFGALSPIYRPHCTMGLARMPWTFGSQAEWVARRYLNMRYRLLPEFYAAAHQNYETGEPILRRLDLDYPQYAEAGQNDQYLITHSLLVAPVFSGGMSTVPSTWLTTPSGEAGLQAEYFNNEDLSGTPILSRIDGNIDFGWGESSPGGLVGTDHFSVRWTGNITVPTAAGDVTLAVTSDDGVRVWINNTLCIGNWGPNNSSTTESAIVLKAGQTSQLRVEFLELTGNAAMRLKYRSEQTARSVWIPPGTWINAWNGSILKGPAADVYSASTDQIPLYIRSGSLFALAPEMQHTSQLPWSPITIDVYPSTTEMDQTSLYEDDTLTTAYKQGAFRTTAIKTWADEDAKTISVSIDAAQGSFAGALSKRAWVLRLRRPPNWTGDLVPSRVTLNGEALGPVVRHIKNATAMPLGDPAGAPDADVFEIRLPSGPVGASNFVVAEFTSEPGAWASRDVGNVGADGNVFAGYALMSNGVHVLRGSGTGIGETNDGFHFMYQPCAGDVQLSARLESQNAAGTNAAAGIMISESLEPSARSAVIALKPGSLIFKTRTLRGSMAQTLGFPGTAPLFMRIVRSGNNFSGYTSADGNFWNLAGSVSIPGFSSNAYVGLVVTAGSAAAANNGITNSSGTVVTGTSSGMEGGVYSSTDTNVNIACFSNVTLGTQLGIAAIADQTALAGSATQPIPFVVTIPPGRSVTLNARSSDTNVLSTGNVLISGGQSNHTLILTPSPMGGACVVTLTANDGLSTASTEFTLFVLPKVLSRELLTESFAGYFPGDMGGQPYRGTGFGAGTWTGRTMSFSGAANDAAQFDAAGLTYPGFESTGGKISMKGDGSNLQGVPDLSATGPFARLGLYDPSSGTIGGGNVSGTLYLRFLIRGVSSNHNGEYGGLHLSRGNDSTGVLIGNAWNALAFSMDYTPTSTEVDLKNNGGSGNYLFVDNGVHLMVAKITYAPGGSDSITTYLDPDPARSEAGQNSASTYVGSLTGDLSFDRFFLRGGNSNKFEYDEIKIGTSWESVLPLSTTASTAPPVIKATQFVAESTYGIFFEGSPGLPYSVLTTSNLSLAGWQTVRQGTFGFESVLFTHSIPLDSAQCFFRISIP